MSFLLGGEAILIVMAQDAKIDNQKFKACFGQKEKMIPGAEDRIDVCKDWYGRMENERK